MHRLVGFTSFTLMLAHIVLVTVGYSAGTDLGVIATFVDQVLHSPGMLLALAGTIALVMVVVTSVKKARARLRYESWHLLHLYAYLGAGLALPHQALDRGGLHRERRRDGVLVGSVRLRARRRPRLPGRAAGAPLPPPPPRRLRGRHGVADRDLRRHDGAPPRPPARPGRPVLPVALPRRPGVDPRQPVLLSAAPDGRSLRITAEAVGASSARLASLRPGTPVVVEGPYGRLHTGVRTREKAVLIGAGIGITPLRAVLEEPARLARRRRRDLSRRQPVRHRPRRRACSTSLAPRAAASSPSSGTATATAPGGSPSTHDTSPTSRP